MYKLRVIVEKCCLWSVPAFYICASVDLNFVEMVTEMVLCVKYVGIQLIDTQLVLHRSVLPNSIVYVTVRQLVPDFTSALTSLWVLHQFQPKHICSPPSMLLNCPVRQHLWSHSNTVLYKFCIIIFCIIIFVLCVCYVNTLHCRICGIIYQCLQAVAWYCLAWCHDRRLKQWRHISVPTGCGVVLSGLMSWQATKPVLCRTFYLHASCARSRHCFWQCLCVHLCVCLSTKSQKLLIRNRCNLVGICPMVNARSDWKLVTFDLDLWPRELFSYYFDSGYTSTMARPSSFILVWRYNYN